MAASTATSTAAGAAAPTAELLVGVCQIDVGDDKQVNLDTAKAAIASAASRGAKLVVLPECFNSPYDTKQFRRYAEEVPAVGTEGKLEERFISSRVLQQAAVEHGVYLVGGSIPEIDADKVYNTCTIWSPSGKLLGKHRKVHLFDIDIPGGIRFQESETLSAGDSITLVDLPWGTMGVGICYDMRFPLLASAMRARGARFLVYPGAFNTTTGPVHWELLQRARALDNQCFVVTASPARSKTATYQAWGHSSVVDPWGTVISTCEHEPHVQVVSLNLDRVDQVRRQIPVGIQARTDLYTLTSKM